MKCSNYISINGTFSDPSTIEIWKFVSSWKLSNIDTNLSPWQSVKTAAVLFTTKHDFYFPCSPISWLLIKVDPKAWRFLQAQLLKEYKVLNVVSITLVDIAKRPWSTLQLIRTIYQQGLEVTRTPNWTLGGYDVKSRRYFWDQMDQIFPDFVRTLTAATFGNRTSD